MRSGSFIFTEDLKDSVLPLQVEEAWTGNMKTACRRSQDMEEDIDI